MDAEILLAHLLGTSRTTLIAHPDSPVSLPQRIKYTQYVRQRKKGVPLAYLTGTKEFFGQEFFVNKHTLIPRPETEAMVDASLKHIAASMSPLFCDIGTGSGCIAISVATHMEKKNTPIYATDISKQALKVAKKNAANLGASISFFEGSLLSPLRPLLSSSSHDIIIAANLPYITEEQFDHEPTIQYEPKSALVAAHAGCALYEQLLLELSQSPIRSRCICLFEIDPDQTRMLTSTIYHYFPTANITVQKDLAGLDRMLIVQLTAT